MERIFLNEGWLTADGDETVTPAAIPGGAKEIALPYDVLPYTARDYAVSFGAESGYYPTVVSYFYKTLPAVKGATRVWLALDGVLGAADIYIGGRFIAHCANRTFKTLDVTDRYQSGALLALRIVTHPDTGRYAGNGIGGGVSLLTASAPLYVAPFGVRVATKTAGEKALLFVSAEVINASGAEAERTLTVEIFNQKGKRVAKKNRRIKIPANGGKTFELAPAFTNPFLWSCDNPYLYTARVSLVSAAGKAGDTAQVSFGVAQCETKGEKLRLNGKPVVLAGVTMAHDNGMLGLAALRAAEERKFAALKEIGYCAVRYTECPAETVLDVLDRSGLLCFVDVFARPAPAFRSGDGHARSQEEREEMRAQTEKALRNHPCAALYASADGFDAEQLPAEAFTTYGADFAGSAPSVSSAQKQFFCTLGALDRTFRRKIQSYHHEIRLGKSPVCAIAVRDPDIADSDPADYVSDMHALWNWPRHLGKPVKVVVYSTGDIVALYLDGKSVGRKLTGKFSNYTAVFKTDFYPGRLEAVSFLKGKEHARCVLNTVSSPKNVKPECAVKELSPGACAYIDIAVTDGNGYVVPYADRLIELDVSEEGELLAFASADPFDGASVMRHACAVFDGRAVAVVRAKKEGKITVRATGEGLSGGKITVKVKPAE